MEKVKGRGYEQRGRDREKPWGGLHGLGRSGEGSGKVRERRKENQGREENSRGSSMQRGLGRGEQEVRQRENNARDQAKLKTKAGEGERKLGGAEELKKGRIRGTERKHEETRGKS